MKKHFLIIVGIVCYSASGNVLAQSVGQWQLPRVEIPLVEADRTIAVLKVRLISKSASIHYAGAEYYLKLKKDKSMCMITTGQTPRLVATIAKMGSKKIEVTSTEGNSFVLDRTGKKKQRQYFREGVPFLAVQDDQVMVNKANLEGLELLVQAAIVFRLVYVQYDAERSSNTVYYPIVTAAATDH